MNTLPRQGNLGSVRAAKNTAKILMLTEEERKEFEVVVAGQTTTWNEKGKEEKEFEIPPSSVKLIKDTLRQLDEQKQLSIDLISVYDKFFPDEAEPADNPA
jgi:hypothetical protein